MTGKRSYDDGCASAHALDLVGERWALLVVRELLLGPKRFTDLRAGLPGISPNVLTLRLEELERIGVLLRRRLWRRAWSTSGASSMPRQTCSLQQTQRRRCEFSSLLRTQPL